MKRTTGVFFYLAILGFIATTFANFHYGKWAGLTYFEVGFISLLAGSVLSFFSAPAFVSKYPNQKVANIYAVSKTVGFFWCLCLLVGLPLWLLQLPAGELLLKLSILLIWVYLILIYRRRVVRDRYSKNI